jgi:putative endonuclease
MLAKDVLGKRGEQMAADYLAANGLAILERNWRCAQGEIDIVAADGRTLVICEVKTRSATRFGTPLESVTAQKARRLRRLAVLWLRDRSAFFDAVRIDIVGVLLPASGEASIEHVSGVG